MFGNGFIMLIQTLLRRTAIERSYRKDGIHASEVLGAEGGEQLAGVGAARPADDRHTPAVHTDDGAYDFILLLFRKGGCFAGGADRHEVVDAIGNQVFH